MTAFPSRSEALRRVITARHSPSDGGWPHRLDVDNAASSIVSTAHVIEMLRTWNYEFRDPAVKAGLSYLADSVEKHTQRKSVQGLGRGEFSRYPAFALWGLTRFPQTPFSAEFSKGTRFALEWLGANRLKKGGWGMQSEEELSFTVTMPAVHALDRIAFHPKYGKAATLMAEHARNAVVKANRGAASSPWWTPYGDSAPPSGAATAMAVLTLAGGSDSQRKLARRGIAWLLSNPAEWVDRTETDMLVEDRSWQMMSFSLGLRAVLHPCAKEAPDAALIRSAIRYWDDLWVDAAGAWAHYPGGIPSTTGSFGIIVAARALKRAFPFDPAAHFDVRSRGRRRTSSRLLPRPRLTVELFPPEQHVRIVNQQGVVVVDTAVRGPAQWRALELVAAHHLRAVDARDQVAQTIALQDLATAVGSSQVACAKAVDRLNETLRIWADRNHSQFLPDLIEDVSPSGSKGRRYGLEEIDVIFLKARSSAK